MAVIITDRLEKLLDLQRYEIFNLSITRYDRSQLTGYLSNASEIVVDVRSPVVARFVEEILRQLSIEPATDNATLRIVDDLIYIDEYLNIYRLTPYYYIQCS